MKKVIQAIVWYTLAAFSFADEFSLSPLLISDEMVPVAGTFDFPVQLPASDSVLLYIPNLPMLPVDSVELVDDEGNSAGASITAVSAADDASRLFIPYDGWLLEMNEVSSGRYHVRGTCGGSLPIPIQGRVIGSEHGFLIVAGNPSRTNAIGVPVPLTVILGGGGRLYSGASVNIKVYDGDVVIEDATVLDDGANGDFESGDGAYNHVFVPTAAGNYRVDFELANIDSTNPSFVSNLSVSIAVDERQLSLFEDYTVTTPDHDADGYFDELVITYTLDELIPPDGMVELYTQIKVGDSLLEDFRSIDMPASSISSRFDGMKLRGLGKDGEISIEKVVVRHQDQYRYARSALGTTDFYYETDWEREDLLLLPGMTDAGVNLDSDAFLEQIDITFSIDSIVAGDFGFSASVYNDAGNKVGVFGSQLIAMEPGTNDITIQISAREFSAEGENTRLTVRNLFIYPNNYSDSILQTDLLGTTANTYECWDFVGCENGPNSLPIAVDDFATSGGGAIFINVTSNDNDPDGDLLSVQQVTTPSSGIAEIIGNSVQYTPNPGFSGTDSFEYVIYDLDPERFIWKRGTATGTATISVEINSPPVANDDTYSVSPGIQAQLFVLENDSDDDGDRLYISDVTQPASGTVTSYGNSVVYEAAADFTGEVSFSYTILDVDINSNVAKGGSDSALVALNVGTVENKAPIANDDSYSVSSTGTTTLSVLDNDSDPEGGLIYISRYTSASKGSVSLVDNGIEYTPTPGAAGTDSFAYTVSDQAGLESSATVQILIDQVNQAPLAKDDAISTIGGNAVTIDVLGNDFDPNGDRISILNYTQPLNGSIVISGAYLVYTPAANFSGNDAFSYTITDGSLDSSAQVQIYVEPVPVNQPPVANDDAVSVVAGEEVFIYPLANDEDPEGQTILITAVSPAQFGIATQESNTVRYLAPVNFSGTDTVTYTVSDGELESTAKIAISVTTADNTAPRIEITSPGNGEQYVFGQQTDLSATAVDSEDGDISAAISWTSSIDGQLLIGASGSVALSTGEHFLTASITDSSGTSVETSVEVMVRELSDVFANSQTFNIPDRNGRGIDSIIDVPLRGVYTRIVVTANIDHPKLSDIGVLLDSPSGRKFKLEHPNAKGNETSWEINLSKPVSVNGDWVLKVSDHKKGNVGKLTGWTIFLE